MSTLNDSSDEFVISVDKNSLLPNSTYQWSLPIPQLYRARNKEIALARAQIYNAIPNVDFKFNNTSFDYYVPYYSSAAGASGDDIMMKRTVNLIPTGSTTGVYMTISDINAVFQQVMYSNGDFLIDPNGNPFYFMSIASVNYADKFTIQYNYVPSNTELSNSLSPFYLYKLPSSNIFLNAVWKDSNSNLPSVRGYSMYITLPPSSFNSTNSSLGSLLGLSDNASYPAINFTKTVSSTLYSYSRDTSIAGRTVSPFSPYNIISTSVPQITPVTSLILQCSWVGNSQFNTVAQRVASIPINASYNGIITFDPSTLLYYPVLDGPYSSLNLTLCSQDGSPLSNLLEGVQILFDFHVRNRKVSTSSIISQNPTNSTVIEGGKIKRIREF